MSDYNIVGSPFSPFGQYAIDDLDMDINYGAYPMIGGNGSVFGNGFATMPMMGIGGTGGFSYQNMYQNMEEMQRFQTDYSIRQQELNRNADLRINAPMESIKGAATALKDKIANNEQDQIQAAYERYVNAVAAAYGSDDPAMVKARANTLYQNMNNGVSLPQELRQNAHSSGTQGFIQALTFGAYGRHSAEDNISVITGSPVNRTEKDIQNTGRLAGASVIGLIAAGIAKACKSGKAGIIGLAAAGVSAAMAFLTGKVST